ncbi:hypothetical protein [Macellibacteroides fermentans]|uniref:hypothetical protein n=1 Tax=Macellibacteroides fermentans TaxID=879969 RepID=UPI00406C266F
MLSVINGLPTYSNPTAYNAPSHDETPDINTAAAKYLVENKMAAIKQNIAPTPLFPISMTSFKFLFI